MMSAIPTPAVPALTATLPDGEPWYQPEVRVGLEVPREQLDVRIAARVEQMWRDGLPDERELKVSWIDPNGPAGKVDIKVGDIVTTIDGVDVAGANNSNSWGLMRAPPGTKLALGLARGTSVTIVLAPP